MAQRVGFHVGLKVLAALGALATSAPSAPQHGVPPPLREAADAGAAIDHSSTLPLVDEPISPIAPILGLDPLKVQLGERLFGDKSLSEDGTVACVTCHDLARGGVNQTPRSFGIGRLESEVNAPTVFNAALNFRQFWDGRAASLEEQIDGPILNPKEMGTTWSRCAARIAGNPDYGDAFGRSYKGRIDADSIKDAIAAYERSLVTPDSRFDHYLLGQRDAISPAEKRGYQLFKDFGCVSCHQGMGVGGNMFEVFGAVVDYYKDHAETSIADRGRYNITHDESDRHVFKVPSLRNVALTAPYFHDGSAKTLGDAVRLMGKYQLGRDLTDDEVGAVTDFLKTLTGTYRGQPL